MKSLAITAPIGLGDIIYLKAMLDSVKERYSEIRIKFYRDIISSYHIHPDYHKFLDEIGALFFSEPPYVLLSEEEAPFYGMVSICTDNQISPVKPELGHLLCKGTPLNIGEYIVISTKVRYLSRDFMDSIILPFWDAMRKLSRKYKIVILGEQKVEMHGGYTEFGANEVYSLYDSIKDHIPADRIVDLSIPALGKTAPQLSQIQQDCLIMRNAKFVVTLGVGGGFCMATAVAKTIGFRRDSDPIADVVFSRLYPGILVTKGWDLFLYHLHTEGSGV